MVLTLKQSKAIAHLLRNKTIVGAAKSAGIPESTLRRWLADDDFRQALQTAQNESVRHAVTRLSYLVNKAVSVVAAAMDSRADAVNLKAAGMAFDQYRLMNDYADLAERVSRLEQQYADTNTQNKNS